ncbi:ligase-associated DNA damage response exonuclease [Teichococcus vastitatis]|uniref:Ligase-associated DNA damage response exonuclease n=1 Tax=Teichococcus vastitatis TaxID=2307076 RepID=A0ABS9W1P3_9PROT|nr:ligase-associated DNA damage response exonuclease [Pseudoroseomonas vastitatis]MCI0753222.1 ligase-associated DNA damage response exonuclease [Pseudoroseomonas vastitatis]
MPAPHPDSWTRITPEGLYCEPGGFHIDPARAVERAVISHGHSDHARPDHGAVLATPETLAIMTARLGEGRAGREQQALPYHQTLVQNGVRVTLVPAGHVLGSAQVVLEWRGSRLVVSGDYKRQPDPTCLPFEAVPCDVFVTEATFALPVFRHPPMRHEVQRLLDSVRLFPQRAHLVGCYALGKCQRLIAGLREAGYDRPLFLHGAQASMCRLYERRGIALGELLPVPRPEKRGATVLPGEIVLAPPSAEANPWARRLADPVTALASGWMRVRQRAKARGVELPLVISDHADWDDLLATCAEVEAPEVWVTHGREEALIHALAARGVRGRALHLIGREEDEGGDPVPAEEEAAG